MSRNAILNSTLFTPHVRTRTVVDPQPFGPGLNAHRRVAAVAIVMANHHFEAYMRDNAMYRRMRAEGQISEADARKIFVIRVAPRLLEDARKALTNMLTQPDTLVPPAMKDEIAEALILDSDLRGRRVVASEEATVPTGLH